MRKLSIILLSAIAVLLIAIAARAGDFYTGEFLTVVDIEPACGGNIKAGTLEVTKTGPFSVKIEFYVEMPNGDWVKVGEEKATRINNIMFYPMQDQVINFNQAPWFYDAVVTSEANPAVFLWLDDSSFVRVIAPSSMTCEGIDCDLAAIEMQINCLPCNLPLQVIKYGRDSE